MSLSIGIVGLPNVGKSTLFNALTDNDVLAANYPFATIELNTGIVPIPDERLEKLAELYDNAPIKPATVTFVDIAGLVKGAAQGAGLGNQFLSHIRSVDAICHVVRAFETGDVAHVEQNIDPKRDIDIINTELVLADLQTVSNWLPRLEKETKSQPKLADDLNHLRGIYQALNNDTPLHQTDLLDDQQLHALSHDYQTFVRQLIASKPVLYVFNIDEGDLRNPAKQASLAKLVAPAPSLLINAQLEAELNVLSSTERREMLALNHIEEPGLFRLIGKAYELLGLQSFLTAGPKEVRAWTVHGGATAPDAAEVIHTDFKKGFIAAEVVSFGDLITTGSLSAARSAGKVRTEGKSYIMQPDDIVEFRFNV